MLKPSASLSEMNKIKLSIVVPVYGVEKYIEKCLSSLLSDNNSKYEIIIINDGTKDRSIDIVRENFTDSRIHIFEQDNKGLSAARNLGMTKAMGEYVWFVDSDDWIEVEEIPKIIDCLDDIDALYFGSYFADYENTGQFELKALNNRGETGKELACSSFAHCVPYYVMRRKLLVDCHLSFKEGILHEDSLFTPIFIMHCNKVRRYDNPVYHHLQRVGSITQTVSPKRVKDLICVTNTLLEYGRCLDKDIRYQWGHCIAEITHALLSCEKKCDNVEMREITKQFVNTHPDILDYLKCSSRNNRIMARLAKLLCGNLYLTYSILYKLRY